MKKKILSTVALLSCFAFNANAELIDADYLSSNDNLVTFDTKSGLEWLDLTETLRMSVNEVESQLVEGGQFYGWRFPTKEEVYALIDNNILNAPTTNYGSVGYVALPTTEYSSIMFEKFGAYYGSYYKDKEANTSTFAGVYSTLKYSYKDRNTFAANQPVGYFGNYAGVYLVSDGGLTLSSIQDPTMGGYRAISSVPLGATAGLLALGLMGFRKRK